MRIDGEYTPLDNRPVVDVAGWDSTALPMTGTFFPPAEAELRRLQADLSPSEELLERIEQLEARVAKLEARQP